MFQRFWRGEQNRTSTERRSGLGLTIVRQIAEAHGGEVKLVSAPGAGSTFALWAPALVAAPAHPVTSNAAPIGPPDELDVIPIEVEEPS